MIASRDASVRAYCFAECPSEAAMNTLSVAGDVAPLVLEQRKGGVAFLTLNRPAQYNALSEEMLAALEETLNALSTDASVRVVVLGGAGKAFCAGQPLDDADPVVAATGHCAGTWDRNRCGLPAGGRVRPRDRGQ
jgi:hypothetical protein